MDTTSLDSPPVDDWYRFQAEWQGGLEMRTYKVIYNDDRSETIKAASFRDIDGTWVEFLDGQKNQLLRVRAVNVERIEVASD